MRYLVSLFLIGLFVVSSLAQDSNKYVLVQRITLSGKTFQMLKDTTKITEIGGDSTSFTRSVSQRDSTNSRQTPPRESQLEDRQYNNYDFTRLEDNQYVSVGFSNISGKKIKSLTFQLRLTENGKKYFEKNVKAQPRLLNNGDFYISERFFSTKNLTKDNIEREIIVKEIQFTDGTKLKF